MQCRFYYCTELYISTPPDRLINVMFNIHISVLSVQSSSNCCFKSFSVKYRLEYKSKTFISGVFRKYLDSKWRQNADVSVLP